jgi:hypothetical protein
VVKSAEQFAKNLLEWWLIWVGHRVSSLSVRIHAARGLAMNPPIPRLTT